MNDSTLNIKVAYLYRDAGNYKQFGFQVFANASRIPLLEIEEAIQARLIDGAYFDASKWSLPALHLHTYDAELDHHWHEFEKIEPTPASPTSDTDIAHFLQSLWYNG